MFMTYVLLGLSLLYIMPCFGAKQCQCDCTKCFQNRSKVLAAAAKYQAAAENKRKEISVRAASDNGVNKMLYRQLKENLPFIEERLSSLKELPVRKQTKSLKDGEVLDESEDDDVEEEDKGKENKIKTKDVKSKAEVAVRDLGDAIVTSGTPDKNKTKESDALNSQTDETEINTKAKEQVILNKTQENIEHSNSPELNQVSLNPGHNKELNSTTFGEKSEEYVDTNKTTLSVPGGNERGLVNPELKDDTPESIGDKSLNFTSSKDESAQINENPVLKSTSNTTLEPKEEAPQSPLSNNPNLTESSKEENVQNDKIPNHKNTSNAALITSEPKEETPENLVDKNANLVENSKEGNVQSDVTPSLKNAANTTSLISEAKQDLQKSQNTKHQDVKGSLMAPRKATRMNKRKLTASDSTGEDESLVEKISREIAKAIAEEERLMAGKNVTIERLRKARIHYAVVQAVKKLDNVVEKVGSRDPDSYSKKIKEHVIKSEELRKVVADDEGLAVRGGHKVELAPIATDYMRLVMARSFNKPPKKPDKAVKGESEVEDQQ